MDTEKPELFKYGLPTRYFIAAMAISFILISAYAAYSWKTHRDFHNIYASHITMDRDLAHIRLLDEALTISARMAVVSGEPEYRRNYLLLEPRLSAIIKGLRENPQRAGSALILSRMDAANRHLAKIEKQALSYGEKNKKEAAALLASPGYLRHKRDYASAAKELEAASDAIIGEEDANLRRMRLNDITASTATLAVAFLSWVFAMAAIRRWRREAPATVELLREREEQYRHLYNNVQEVAYRTDLMGKIIDITPSIKKYSGFTREELVGKPVHGVYQNPGDRSKLLRELLAKGEVEDYELNLKSKDGKHLVVSANAHILRGPLGLPVGVEGTLRDISARKRAEIELKEYADRLNYILQTSPAAIISVDLNERITSWNRAAEKIFGWEEKELLGKPNPTIPADKRGEFSSIVDRIKRGETITDLETRRAKRDGTLVDVSISDTPMRATDGGICGVLGVLLDISERKKAETSGKPLLTEGRKI